MGDNEAPASRRGSVYDDAAPPSRRGSLYAEEVEPPASRRGSLYGDESAAPTSRRGSVHADEPTAPTSRRQSLHGADDQLVQEPTRRSSIINPPTHDDNTTDIPPPPPPLEDSTGEDQFTQRKRTERRHGMESMFSLDNIFSRDLRITGVSKKGSSWRYHIEVLDIRGSLMPFTDTFVSNSTPSSSTMASPASSSMVSLPSQRSTLPPVVRYSVMRRYNDFRQLHLYLLDTLDQDVLDSLPKFPDGGLFSYFRGDDPKLLQYRKEQLQKFLRALDELEDTKWSRAFRMFLNPEIDELTTIGGSFAAHIDADANNANSTQAWSGSGLAHINSNSGYVSLSYVKSPEIRFKKQPSDGRGDWKRRKIELANRRAVDEDDHSARSKRIKRLETALDKETENPSDTGDEDDDDSDSEAPRKPYSDLMKLLSLDANQQ